MELNQPEAAAASGQLVAPQKVPAATERIPFTAMPRERLAAFLTYALAYLYTFLLPLLSPDVLLRIRILLVGFVLGFVALTEYLHRDTPRPRESWVWLGCLLTVASAVMLDRCNVWWTDVGINSAWGFLHVFAVWWALSRSATLLEGESGHLLPLDALDGFVRFPFKYFFLRLRTVGFALSQLRGERKRKKPDAETVIWSLVMSAAALGLFVWAVRLLTDADNDFAELFASVADWFRWNWTWYVDATAFVRVLLSLPVGAYLYGLIGGTFREDKDALRGRADAVAEQMKALRGVPERLWLVLLALFCALYALFFAVQTRYLFGAFTRTLPEGFVVSEYARQGFFELCKVMAVNFALLWLVTRSCKTDVRRQKAARALCLVLLAESMLLAVVAFSKLALYIDCFGFTPKRLQSTWLVCVLAFGCGCAAWSLARGAKTFRVWMIFGAATLSLLCLY